MIDIKKVSYINNFYNFWVTNGKIISSSKESVGGSRFQTNKEGWHELWLEKQQTVMDVDFDDESIDSQPQQPPSQQPMLQQIDTSHMNTNLRDTVV